MTIQVLFFGLLKDLVGKEREALELPESARLGDVLAVYGGRFPRLQGLESSIAVSLNQEYAAPDARLHSGDEVALLPPVSGGAPRSPHGAIVHEQIRTDEVLQSLKQPPDGAAVVFEGVVRDHSRGRRTLYLDYEAYEEMALKQMEALVEQALAQFSIRDAAMVHRLGRLEIGETSVLIAVTSAHRAAAFEACRWLIDSLKRTVPIWKKEHFEDGAVWADGEPFPAEISSPSSATRVEPASKLNNP
jgi:molybdopterin synthase catalytic subunit